MLIARLLRLIVYLLTGGLGLVLWYAVTRGEPILPLVCAVAAGGLYAGVLGLEFWFLRRSYPSSAANRPPIRLLVSSWFVEVLTSPCVFLWHQPFRALAILDSPTTQRPRTGVLFVHGFFCNRGLWNPWMHGLRRLGIPFIAVTMEPPFGSIDAYRHTLDAAVRRLEASSGRPPILVGHSMGGLAIRAWRAQRGESACSYRVVTIGTPHRGTWMARHSRTSNGREMRMQSPWLRALARAEAASGYDRFVCFWSRCDNIVFPTDNATLPGADNRHLPATPHVAMAYHADVFDAVVRMTAEGTESNA